MTMRYQFTGGQSGVNDPVDPNTQRPRPKPKAKRNTRQQPQQQTFNDPVDPTRQTGVKTNNLPSGIQQQAPMMSPVPFAQQLVQSGMMNMNPIWDTSSGQGVRAPGYSVNPMHPMWGSPTPPQFPNPGMNPMNYYWDNPGMQNVPRVWTGREMTPEGFMEIMNQYGANIPWMRQMQMNPFGF